MAKTNFTKVEEALNEGLLKMTVNELQRAAPSSSSESHPDVLDSAQAELMATLKFEAHYSKDPKLFTAGGISKKELQKMLDEKNGFSPEKWEQLKLFQQKVDAYKKERASKLPEDANEKLIESQQKRHVNKRYNTKEEWLPLH